MSTPRDFSLKENQVYITINGSIAKKVTIKTKTDRYLLRNSEHYTQIGYRTTDFVKIIFADERKILLFPNKMIHNKGYHILPNVVEMVLIGDFEQKNHSYNEKGSEVWVLL